MGKILTDKLPKTKFLDEENAIEVELISSPPVEDTEKMIINVCYGHSDPSIYYKLRSSERRAAIDEVIEGGTLPKALEMTGKFVFLIKNVPLTFTHCIVRHRFFTILQMSTATDDLRNSDFLMPRSFSKDMSYYNEVKKWYLEGKRLFCEGVDKQGLSVQNARLLIPKNNCNHMFVGFDIKAFAEAYSQRTCTQEEPIQSNIVFKMMAEKILKLFPYFKDYFKSGCETGRCLHSKPGKQSNIVFKRNELHKKFLPSDYDLSKEETLHSETRDYMNDGPPIDKETYLGGIKQ